MMRIQVEEMHVYYFIARKMISATGLGFLGLVSSREERLLTDLYNSNNKDEVSTLSLQLLDRLNNQKVCSKINMNVYNSGAKQQLINDAVFCLPKIYNKSVVFDNVFNSLKSYLSTVDKIKLCISKIVQAKNDLFSLSPEQQAIVLDGKEFLHGEPKGHRTLYAVDAENVDNVQTVLVEDCNSEVQNSVSKFIFDNGELAFDYNNIETVDNDLIQDNIVSNSIEEKLKEIRENAEEL